MYQTLGSAPMVRRIHPKSSPESLYRNLVRRPFFLIALAVLVTSCVVGMRSTPNPPAPAVSQADPALTRLDIFQKYERLGVDLPGFAGLIDGSSKPIAVLTTNAQGSDPVQTAAVLTRYFGERLKSADNLFTTRDAQIAPDALEFVAVAYSYASLTGWSKQLWNFFQISKFEVYSSGVSLRRNKIVFSRRTEFSDSQNAELSAYLLAHEIPLAALEFELGSVPRLESSKPGGGGGSGGGVIGKRLTDASIRPLIGGLRVNIEGTSTRGTPYRNACTLGFFATFGSQRGFVTNLHCTDLDAWNEPFNLREKAFQGGFQTFDQVGMVTRKGLYRPVGPGTGCTQNSAFIGGQTVYSDGCLYVDAAFFESKDSNGIPVAFKPGTFGDTNINSTVIASELTYTNIQASSNQGTFFKIGSESGKSQFSFDQIDQTELFAQSNIGYVVLKSPRVCGYIETGTSAAGDSGGPVFTAAQQLAGLHATDEVRSRGRFVCFYTVQQVQDALGVTATIN